MIKKWIAKALIQKTISILPFSFKINYFFQQNITKAVKVNEVFFKELVTEGNKLLKQLEDEKLNVNKLNFLELGTGWHPILPIYLFLCGSSKICTVDLNNHLRIDNLISLLKLFLVQYSENKLSKFVQKEKILTLERIVQENNLSVEEILKSLNIETKVGDFTTMSFKTKFDVCFSINVLEHIHESILEKIMTTFYNNSKSKSLHFHSFGSYDHFCHIDNSISKFNFLRFSKRAWKFIDNDIQPQNRWRVSNFKELFIAKDFKIKAELHSQPNIAELEKIKLHKDFKDIPKEICAIDYGVFLLEK